MKLVGAGQGFFDRWTLVHLTFWIMVGGNLGSFIAQGKLSAELAWVMVAGGAILWELFETYLDKYTTMPMVNESWLNRWVSDPLMAFVGAGVGMGVMGT
jgi:hypothetical protein